MNEVCDEKRFTKMVSGALDEIRNGVHDGLFTAYPGEHNWEIAHRVLMPGRVFMTSLRARLMCIAFGPLSIRSMFDEMHDIASQLVVKWARFGPKEKINVPDDFTRLTLDSIALCVSSSFVPTQLIEIVVPWIHDSIASTILTCIHLLMPWLGFYRNLQQGRGGQQLQITFTDLLSKNTMRILLY